MNMQDKDMDQLFRAKLDNYEIEPSPMVWANISNELGAGAQRKSIVPLLRIAASVAIVISAGAYFWPKQQTAVKGDQPKQMASAVKPVVSKKADDTQQTTSPAQTVNTATATPVKPVVNTQPKQVYAAVQHRPVVNQAKAGAAVSQTVVNPSQAVSAPVNTDPVVVNTQPQQIIASVQPQIVTPVTNSNTTTTAAVPDMKLNEMPVNTAKQADAIAAVPVKKHKIRGLGGLLNAAVGLVDRREDKIIEFTNNDDGDTITGINLGIVSIKKNNNK